MKNIRTNLKRVLFASLLMVLGLTTTSASVTNSIKFMDVKVEEALAKASAEGKLVFMDFYASWCTPCKWMEKTTFADLRITSALNENFVSIKVDIDNVEGFQMKNKYEVNYLPTILILNSNGEMVERIEQTMVADDLIGILEIHNSPENKVVIKHDFNQSPKRINGAEDAEKDVPWTIRQNDYRRYLASEEKRNYRVQTGVYTDYTDAHAQVQYLRNTFIEPIMVMNDFKGDKVLFKVMLGQFKTSSEAQSFCNRLKINFKIDAIVN